jgi:hypothetical protein
MSSVVKNQGNDYPVVASCVPSCADMVKQLSRGPGHRFRRCRAFRAPVAGVPLLLFSTLFEGTSAVGFATGFLREVSEAFDSPVG